MWDYVYGTNLQHALVLARRMLAHQHGTKQIIVVTDGEPTAHIDDAGEVVFFNYPPVPETLRRTMAEVIRCTRAGIMINTFVLDLAAHPLPLRRADRPGQRRPHLLHHARRAGRLRAGRLPPAPPRPPPRRLAAGSRLPHMRAVPAPFFALPDVLDESPEIAGPRAEGSRRNGPPAWGFPRGGDRPTRGQRALFVPGSGHFPLAPPGCVVKDDTSL